MAVGAQTKDGRSTVPTIPKFQTKEEEQRYCKQHLVAAFRVFADRGYDEGVAGHMSLRDPIQPDHFWINPYAMHFADITVSDLVLVNEDAEVVQGDHAVNAAGFSIHSEIHKAHPWINAVCHAHTVYGKAYSVFGKKLPPVMQDSLRFYGSHSVNLDYGGVVLSSDEGKNIAATLGPRDKVCILQNHGLLSVGETIDEAAYWFVCFDKCCQAQLAIDAVVHAQGDESRPKEVDHKTAFFTEQRIGTRHRGWLNFQPYYTNMVRKTKGEFLL
ncbi:class II aldolase/adducin N-terminal [Plectosphaerella plurivora]|uniref:Class II aldolase/adducin N-terminal n=1 Tax=Plectosphaerella plurivora TaxID=936078 RepID=A0A9P8V669_9PEZI|nr:class II aldolase/adducin N-terminal [Plectosphaerella plurivora]